MNSQYVVFIYLTYCPLYALLYYKRFFFWTFFESQSILWTFWQLLDRLVLHINMINMIKETLSFGLFFCKCKKKYLCLDRTPMKCCTVVINDIYFWEIWDIFILENPRCCFKFTNVGKYFWQKSSKNMERKLSKFAYLMHTFWKILWLFLSVFF